jgi:hypothetical protein
MASARSYCILLTCAVHTQAFDHFDPAKKGHISVEDLMRCFGSDEEARKILGELDFDGNGVITFEGTSFYKVLSEIHMQQQCTNCTVWLVHACTDVQVADICSILVRQCAVRGCTVLSLSSNATQCSKLAHS